ncbi:MAG: hypothetical protein AB7K52_01940 [Phycisphaerales bacterium]
MLRCIAPVVCLAAGLLFAPLAVADVIEDWSSGNDAAWSRLDFLSSPPGPVNLGGSSYTVAGGTYTIASNSPLPALPSQLGAVSVFGPSIVSNAFSNGTLSTTVRINDSTTEAFLIARGNLALGNYYNMNIGASRGGVFLSINVFSGFTSGASLGNVNIPAIMPGTDYNVAFTFEGSALSGKVWPVGAPEPMAPQISILDATYSAGAVGLGVSTFFNTQGPISATYGPVSFIPGPGTAALAGLALLSSRRRRA